MAPTQQPVQRREELRRGHEAEVVAFAGELERLDAVGTLHIPGAEFPQRERPVVRPADDQRVGSDPGDGREGAVGSFGEGLERGLEHVGVVHGRVDAHGSVGVRARERPGDGGNREVVDVRLLAQRSDDGDSAV